MNIFVDSGVLTSGLIKSSRSSQSNTLIVEASSFVMFFCLLNKWINDKWPAHRCEKYRQYLLNTGYIFWDEMLILWEVVGFVHFQSLFLEAITENDFTLRSKVTKTFKLPISLPPPCPSNQLVASTPTVSPSLQNTLPNSNSQPTVYLWKKLQTPKRLNESLDEQQFMGLCWLAAAVVVMTLSFASVFPSRGQCGG